MTYNNDDEKEQFKAAVKEASREWLNEQFAAFGKWTAISIGAAVFFALVKIAISVNGWPK